MPVPHRKVWGPELCAFEESTVKTAKLPRDANISMIWLWMELSDVVSGGSASGTVVADAVQKLLSRVEIIADGDTIFSVPGRDLYHINTMEAGCPLQVLPPSAGAAATYPINLLLAIPFANNLGVRPLDTILEAWRYKTLELAVTWAEPDAAMFTGTYDRISTISSAYGVRPIVEEILTEVQVPFIRRRSTIESVISATSGDHKIVLPADGRIYQAIHVRTTDADVRESDIVNKITLVTGDSFYHMRSMESDALNAINEASGRLESPITGFYSLYLMDNGKIGTGVRTDDVNSAVLQLDVTVGAGTTKAIVTMDWVKPSAFYKAG